MSVSRDDQIGRGDFKQQFARMDDFKGMSAPIELFCA